VISPIIQEENTGCGIASVANVVGKSYAEMKALANSMGIYASDTSLWSDTQYVRHMLSNVGVEATENEILFESWGALPDLALLAIKHHQEEGRDFWHWVVFKRVDGRDLVLDSASYLTSNVRTDFNEMQPKWYIGLKTKP
jgi:predicted double-glycine peptidase